MKLLLVIPCPPLLDEIISMLIMHIGISNRLLLEDLIPHQMNRTTNSCTHKRALNYSLNQRTKTLKSMLAPCVCRCRPGAQAGGGLPQQIDVGGGQIQAI
jgi:hypothetical protein